MVYNKTNNVDELNKIIEKNNREIINFNETIKNKYN